MAANDWANSAAHTLESLYGDLLDLPLFAPPAAAENIRVAPARTLESYAEEIRYCQSCVLHIGRKQLVFGRGSPEARVAFVGDFPSESDNEIGEVFSDEAGALLNKMIVAMKVRPEEAYLTNAFKCHPPIGQGVDTELFRQCERHLLAQLEMVAAPVIVAMGERAAQALARSESPLRVLRKQEYEWNGRRVICTHHPRELLHSPAKKKEAWEDLQAVMRILERL
jgi:DNA polymerase